ncbi:MAG: site-specific integrase [Oscillospiraceae bacterium]|nr:site-specific integrase [Oscillospiraceae bacterium]
MPQSKRTTSGMGSIRKVTKVVKGKEYTYYEARYTEGFDPRTGKQIQHSITDKSKKVVAQKLKAAVAAIDAGTYKAPCKMTVAQWLDIWVAEYLNSVKPLTKHNYNKQVQKHLKPALGAARLEALDTHTIQRFYNSLIASGLSPKTVKNVHGILHCALQQAIACDYISRNPADACKLPKVTKPEIKPLEPEEIARLLKEAEQDDYCNLFIVAMFTGMRQGELLGLAWECVDFQTGIITVKQQLQCKDGNYFLETPKSGKNRTILPAPIVMDALRNQMERQQKEQEQAREMWDNQFGLVFTDALGKYLVRRTVVKHFKKISQRAGISDDARFHDLRHSFAVSSLYAGDDIKTVQANLGHATAQFTLDVYGHVTQKMRQDSANRMQKFYEQLSSEKAQ